MHSSHKRRRIDAASTLSRPFKSPFRVAPNQDSASERVSEGVVGGQPCTRPDVTSESATDQANTSYQQSSISPASSPIRNVAPNRPSPSSQSSPIRKDAQEASNVGTIYLSHRLTTTASFSGYKSGNSEYTTLQKQHTRLLNEVANLRKSTDTTQQALTLEASSQDMELESLINKWRGIAREAAEELFRVAKDKVNRMGGVGAWRERNQKRNTPWAEDDKQPWSNSGPEEIDEDGLTDEQKDALAEMREEAAEEMRKYGETTVPEQKAATEGPDQGKDETFTMDMMLQQLNVELDIIGYDAEMQRWTES